MELILTVIVESLAALGFPGKKKREEKWRAKMAAKKAAAVRGPRR